MCPFAQVYVNQEKAYTVEGYVEDPELPGSLQYVLRPKNKRETHISQLASVNHEDEVESVEEKEIFDSEAYKAFWDEIDHKTKRIEVISDVLFNHLSYAELADKHGFKDAEVARASFYKYIRSFARRTNLLEQEELRLKHIRSTKEKLVNNYGRMSEGLKKFLCFYCLNMSVNEIMDLFKNGRNTVHDTLKKYKQHLENGELKLMYDEDGYIVEASRKAGKPKRQNCT
jgi:predicted DNA-binding protein YlxM (UPF0122 family)